MTQGQVLRSSPLTYEYMFEGGAKNSLVLLISPFRGTLGIKYKTLKMH